MENFTKNETGKLTESLLLSLENFSRFTISNKDEEMVVESFNVSGNREGIYFELHDGEIVVTCSDRRIKAPREGLLVIEETGTGRINQLSFDAAFYLTSSPLN